MPPRPMAASMALLRTLLLPVPLLLLLAVLLLPPSLATPSSQFPEIDPNDPLANTDRMKELSEAELNSLLGHPDDTKTVAQLLQDLDKKVNFIIDIILVGFNGDGQDHIKISEVDLERYLKALKTSQDIHVIHSHRHFIESQITYTFRISHDKSNMLGKISEAINGELRKHPETEEGGVELSYEIVDGIVAKQHQKLALAYGLFIINTPITGSTRYWYSSKTTRDRSKPRQECGTTMWAAEERYVWIDLSAGPLNFGPVGVEEGAVTVTSIPRLSNFKTSTTFETQAFIANLASFVAKTCEHVFVPPINWFPLHDRPLLISVVHVNRNNKATDLPFDWKKIQELVKGIHYHGQAIEFSEYRLSVREWHSLHQAYSNSRRVRGGFNSSVTSELDAQELHHLILQSLAFVSIMKHTSRVVPIFVFDLDFDVPFSRAPVVASRDMVIFLHANQSNYFSQFSCRAVPLTAHWSPNARDNTRFILGGLLQTAWGVAPSFQTWSPIHQTASEDYTFATGLTPFGPFSSALGLSFALRDAIARSLLILYKNDTVTELQSFLKRFENQKLEIRDIMTKDSLPMFHYRWSFLIRKLDQGVESLSFHSFKYGTMYFRSLRHDLAALKETFHLTLLFLSTARCQTPQGPTTSILERIIELGLLLSMVGAFTVFLKRSSMGAKIRDKDA